MIDILYAPAQPFVWHPLRACIPACIFFLFAILLFARRDSSARFVPFLLAITGAVWILFGLNELVAKRHGWDIRVDLLFLWPSVLLLSLVAFTLGIIRIFERKQKENANSPSRTTFLRPHLKSDACGANATICNRYE